MPWRGRKPSGRCSSETARPGAAGSSIPHHSEGPLVDFSWISDPTALIALATLVVMEVVLGIDNLIFISILTNKLPENQRSRARRIGIGLALILRLACWARSRSSSSSPSRCSTVFGHRLLLARPDPDRRRPVPGLEGDEGDPSQRRPGPGRRPLRQRQGDAGLRRGDRADPAARPGLLARQHHHRGRHDRPCADHGDRGDLCRGVMLPPPIRCRNSSTPTRPW